MIFLALHSKKFVLATVAATVMFCTFTAAADMH